MILASPLRLHTHVNNRNVRKNKVLDKGAWKHLNSEVHSEEDHQISR